MRELIESVTVEGKPRQVFISYSHEDADYKNRILEALKPLKDEKKISTWHDREIKLGQEWDGVINEKLAETDLFLLLVSPTFLNSNYCRKVELRHAMRRARAKEAILIPIILRKCEFEKEPFAKYQAYPLDGSPLESASNDAAWPDELRESLRHALAGYWYPPKAATHKDLVWTLTFSANSCKPEDLVDRLRKAAACEDIGLVNSIPGPEFTIELDGPSVAMARIRRMFVKGQLSGALGVQVLRFESHIGATVSAKSFVSDIPVLQANATGPLLMKPSEPTTPDMPVALMMRDEDPSWMFVFPARGTIGATPKDLFTGFQTQFSRDLLSVLAVKDLRVNLAPFNSKNLVTPSLDGIELGTHLLEEDCRLKQYAASLLHPDNPVGAEYWRRLWEQAERLGIPASEPLQSYQKAYVIAGEASVNEKTPDYPFEMEFPERFGIRQTDRACQITHSHLKVLCEADYMTGSQAERLGKGSSNITDASVELFRDLVVPAIEQEINEGSHFTRLRQIYQSVIFGKWIRESILPIPAFAPLRAIVDSDKPELIGIERSDTFRKENKLIHRRYRTLFEKGVFFAARDTVVKGRSTTRVYLSGGLRF